MNAGPGATGGIYLHEKYAHENFNIKRYKLFKAGNYYQTVRVFLWFSTEWKISIFISILSHLQREESMTMETGVKLAKCSLSSNWYHLIKDIFVSG